MGEKGEAVVETARTVLLIGDIHGHVRKLRALWCNLEARVGPAAFRTALVFFLGDYCDRGPHTPDVIDFLISLPARYPLQSHVFLCGNHDLAFAAFVGALPPPPDGSPFAATWPEYEANEEREGWFKGEGHERMHVQGRRWGGTIPEQYNLEKGMQCAGSIYDAGPTFESYGVPHGSPDLMKAVPDDHKKFLASLVWVHEEENVCIDTPEGRISCKLIAVHAGLEKSKDVHQQMKLLKARDTSVPKVECLSGRKNVWEIPKELTEEPTILASGHHGHLYINGLRLVVDESGGIGDFPIAAVVLPSVSIVRDTDDIPPQH